MKVKVVLTTGLLLSAAGIAQGKEQSRNLRAEFALAGEMGNAHGRNPFYSTNDTQAYKLSVAYLPIFADRFSVGPVVSYGKEQTHYKSDWSSEYSHSYSLAAGVQAAAYIGDIQRDMIVPYVKATAMEAAHRSSDEQTGEANSTTLAAGVGAKLFVSSNIALDASLNHYRTWIDNKYDSKDLKNYSASQRTNKMELGISVFL